MNRNNVVLQLPAAFLLCDEHGQDDKVLVLKGPRGEFIYYHYEVVRDIWKQLTTAEAVETAPALPALVARYGNKEEKDE
jgi:hypothetical protein